MLQYARYLIESATETTLSISMLFGIPKSSTLRAYSVTCEFGKEALVRDRILLYCCYLPSRVKRTNSKQAM